jgi:hypothetical protein
MVSCPATTKAPDSMLEFLEMRFHRNFSLEFALAYLCCLDST